jgi:hypothetical protein
MSLLYLSDQYLLGMAVWLSAGVVCLLVLLKLRRHWRGNAARSRWVHAALSAWTLLAALTGVELYFALVYDQTDSFNMTNVSKKWFQRHIVPDQKVLRFSNGKGVHYRDDAEFVKSPEPQRHHVCFVGDSFTFGHGVPDVSDRFSNRIRAALDEAQPGRFVVSNLADAGTDLHWIELLLGELFQDGCRLDTVVYVICLNDIETFHEARDEFYKELGSRGPRFFLFRDTYFFNLLYVRLVQFGRPEIRDYYSFVRDYYAGEPWARMQRKLEQVRRLCERNGAELRVVVFPFLHNLGPEYDFGEAHGKIAAYCRDAGVPVLDLEPVLAPYVSEGLTVSRFDAHPNERAHELAAEAVRARLLADLVTGRGSETGNQE